MKTHKKHEPINATVGGPFCLAVSCISRQAHGRLSCAATPSQYPYYINYYCRTVRWLTDSKSPTSLLLDTYYRLLLGVL